MRAYPDAMSREAAINEWLVETLSSRIAELDIPAASVAVLIDGVLIEHAVGVLNRNTGVENTTDAVFQIGSITKVWTATLVMQLVDEGILDLEAPLRTYLPNFRLAHEDASASVTVRQLLNHTAGFEGDIFRDTGNGDDALQVFIDGVFDVGQLFTPGEQFSYNNLAYCVLGRLVEVLRKKPYDQCLREYIVAPLGLSHAATDAGEAIAFRAAMGHVSLGDEQPVVPAPVWSMMRSGAPAGSMLSMPARELVAFAKMHMNDGIAADGTVVLRPESARAMRELQIELPKLELLGDAWGLGWELMKTNVGSMVGHDGNTLGQAAFLRLLPEHGIAVAMLTNGGNVYPLYREVFAHILGELLGMEYMDLPSPNGNPERIDASRYLGTYGSSMMDMRVSQDQAGRIWVDQVPKGMAIEMGMPKKRAEYVSYGEDRIISIEPTNGLFMPFAFLGDDGDGHAKYLHMGRAMPRLNV